ncbi:hypothetical protein CK203_065194 [Vitis vinifera]|uniref:Tf2-1-like SH3-like domain-containing protein n=1 Tax=Vitis vinifera TaxID=29760 RepID=A0A438G2M6_VITVI|nr:hypothetical protein CK203_065194 [Vitis vinifera]
MVLVKLLPQQFKSLRPVHKGLVRRYEGPFPILGKVGKVSYRVELPPRLKIHPVFHASYLKPYHGDKDDPSRGLSKRAPTAVVTSYDKEGLPESEASWEPADALWQFQEQVSGSGQKARRGRLRHRWGRVSQADSNEPPHGLYRARKLLRLLEWEECGRF